MRHQRLPIFTLSIGYCVLFACLYGPTHQAAGQPADLSPGDTYHLVFVTNSATQLSASTDVPPDSPLSWGGVDAADWVATLWAQFATASTYSMTQNEFVTGNPNVSFEPEEATSYWTAILSDNTNSAASRLDIAGPIYNMQLERVASSEADLFDGSLSAPIRYTELGNAIAGQFQVWTGTGIGGSWTGSSAGNWDNPSAAATIGSANSSTGNWVSSGTQTGGTARLYAVSPAYTVPLLGDFNGDGVVSQADYTVWRDHLGSPDEQALNGNGSFSGGVDAADYELWRENFGQSLPLIGAAATTNIAIPEPTSQRLLLLLAGYALVFCQARISG